MSYRSEDTICAVIVMMVVVAIMVTMFAKSENNADHLIKIDKCIGERVAQDGFMGSLQEAWATYYDSCK